MKKILLVLFSNILFAQTIPEPRKVHDNPITNQEKSNRISEELKEALLPFIEIEKYGLGFIKFNATDDYSSTGASFSIFNPSKKTIKYIWFTVAGENAVGDLVKIGKDTYYKTLKGIGPVKSGGIGEWSFDYVWLTDIVEYLKISTIKIQYMDGTFKTIKYNSNMYIGETAYENAVLALNKKDEVEESKYFPEVTKNDPTIFSDVEQLAEFPGGINAFRNKYSSSFNSMNLTNGSKGIMKTEISFVIEKDGSISDVKAIGDNTDYNNESIRTIKSIKNRWSPAKIKSIPVRSIIKLPLTMNIE